MKVILVLGAGRSSSSLIAYLLKEAESNNWRIIVGDHSEEAARSHIGSSVWGSAIAFNIHHKSISKSVIAQVDVVISLMPPHLHVLAAELCLDLQKHFLTASYISAEMMAFDHEAKTKNLLFLNECGLDPGLDHMSAMQVIDKIKKNGDRLLSFESFTGGLIAPETDPENPWRYKFTWNSRNVVLAGQSTAKFLKNGMHKYIPYQQLFKRTTPLHVTGYGDYEGYANRDSLSYIDTYGIPGVNTMMRGTLRSKGFCDAWNVFVQLGCCDDSYWLDGVDKMTHRDFINIFLANDDSEKHIEERIASQLGLQHDGPELKKLRWSGFFDNTLIGLDKGTPAQLLEHILMKQWKLNRGDKDLIIMCHRFTYSSERKIKEIQSSLIVKGDNAINTAMSKTVGLPLGIVAKLLMQQKIKQRGVIIPIQAEIYEPVLAELKTLGIELEEKEVIH